MFNKKFSKGLAIFASSAILSLSTIQSAYAKPGALSNAPLFLATVVDPNVFFTLDDSGSMDWGPMQDTASGLPVSSGLPSIDGRRRAYYTATFDNLYGTNRCYFVVPPFTNGTIPSWDASWVVRTHLSNRNYYNPAVKYEPWSGLDGNGDPLYVKAKPNEALEHPDKTGGEKVNLETTFTYTEPTNPDEDCSTAPNEGASADLYIPTYYTWPDNNSDGVVDARDIGDGDSVVEVSDLPTAAEILAAEVKIQPGDTKFGIDQWQNFANWFQYYRSRMNSTKYIIGSTINKAETTRMGMRWFNAGHQRNVEKMTNDTMKLKLLEELYEFTTSRKSTPARRALRNTGRYFDQKDSYTMPTDNEGNTAPQPILDSDGGGECQQNFSILMSDGFWNSSTGPGLGNVDKEIKTSNPKQMTGINPNDDPPVAKRFDGDKDQSVDGGNYADEWSDTLADVAMYYYEQDLSDLDDRVRPQVGVDLATHQHLVTYTIAFGLTGTLPADANPLADGFTWPEPVRNTNTTVDDMWHAAYNGRGLYLSAQNPQQLEESLDTALSDIAERTATAAAVAINSAKLTTESIVYLANFNTNGWQGDLQAFKIKTDADGNLSPTGELEEEDTWSAAEELNGRDLGANPRNIYTFNGTKGVAFEWDNLSAAQKADLQTNPQGGTDGVTAGEARLDYVRGYRNNEGTSPYFFRQRQSRLADLVNSGPVYVGAPALNWPDTAPFPSSPDDRYSTFKNGTAKDRTPIVYAGSNGGLMHGFNAGTDDTEYGREEVAYIANFLFSTETKEGLHYLSDPSYAHRYYNDLTPSISDVFDGADWQTLLISGVRGGGRGIFALDITNPDLFDDTENNAEKLVMWEFTHEDDDNLGYTYSRPQIGLANDGSWVAIFGNGFNATGDGRAKLFILKIHAGSDGWQLGDYKTIDAWEVAEDGDNDPNDDADGDGDTDDRNGLSSPALADLDGNGTIDRAYAGDLNGKMWVFDLSSTSSGDWGLAYSSPLFTTIGKQPITAQPTLSRHPTESTVAGNEPNVMVFFGSGQFLVKGDQISNDPQHFFGVWDRGDSGLTSSDLVQQTYENGFVVDGEPVRVLTRNPVDYADGLDPDYGWYFGLPDPSGRERSITRPVVRGDVVFFNTYVPDDDPCEPEGFGYRMAVDIVTGGSPENVTFDVNNDGYIDDGDRATGGGGLTSTVVGVKQEGFLPEPVFIEDIAYTADTPSKVAKLKKIPKGRFSWQELIQ